MTNKYVIAAAYFARAFADAVLAKDYASAGKDALIGLETAGLGGTIQQLQTALLAIIANHAFAPAPPHAAK